MRLASTLNPVTKPEHDIPVAIFCCEGKWKFLLKNGTYQEMMRLVRLRFNLGAGVAFTFETSALDVCQGKSITIDETAYEVMCPFLDEIKVVLKSVDTELAANVKGKGREELLITPEITSPGVVEAATYLQKLVQDTISESSGTPTIANPSNPASISMNKEGALDGTISRLLDEKCLQVAEHQPIDGQHAESDEGHERVEEGSVHEQSRNEPIQEAKKLPVQDTKPQEHGVPIKSEARSSTVERPPIEGVSDDIKEPEPSENKAEDPRFRIFVSSPEGRVAEFKTRGKHQVRKVLAAACKSFGLDLERMSLLLVVEVADDEGHLVDSYESECNSDETVARCGIEADAKLIVRPTEDTDEAQEAEDED